MKIIAASDSSVLVVFGDTIAPEVSACVLGLFHALQARADVRIRNLHPGYTSLLVDFDPLAITHEEVTAVVELLAAGAAQRPVQTGRVVEIPVCYDADFGLDLADVTSHTGLTSEEVVALHASADYQVAFLGFTAGFAYLGGMPQALCTPRLATPRRAVPAGSVGIAGGQTGIYPTETPGGWRLIGRTPRRMFNPETSPPTLVAPGDRVKFVAIGRAEFDRLVQEER